MRAERLAIALSFEIGAGLVLVVEDGVARIGVFHGGVPFVGTPYA